jgi:predicted MFS family arabinose efflux permease
MPSPRTARYFDVLALPHVPLTFGTALVGRTAYALVFLPLLYAVQEGTGSIALAGTAVAIYGATASFLAPARALLIDRYGARPVLTTLILAFGLMLTAIAGTSLFEGPTAAFLVLAGLAGSVAPPLGPSMRVAWGTLTPEDQLLRKSLSLDAVIEELLYLAGPAAAGLALAVIAPGHALLVPAALVIVGGLTFVATPTVGAMRARGPVASKSDRGRSLLFQPRFVGMLLPALVAGAISGTISVAVPVVLAGNGGPAAAGLALGLFAGGSAVGGLLFGAMQVPGSPARQLITLASGLLIGASLIAVVTGIMAVSLVLAAAGLFFSPVMIVAYVAAHAAGGEHRQNAATTWVNTSHNLGGAGGSALAGILIQLRGSSLAVTATASGAVLLLLGSAVLARQGRRDPKPEAAAPRPHGLTE